MKYSKEDALNHLINCDHAFLSEEGVIALTEPFGFKGESYLAKANPQDFKGLSLWFDYLGKNPNA